MINKLLYIFLEKIFIYNTDFKDITEIELKRTFKNNQYYNLKKFCLQNKLINNGFHKISLTQEGLTLFNFLKNYIKIYK